jgi:hypothetical protein
MGNMRKLRNPSIILAQDRIGAGRGDLAMNANTILYKVRHVVGPEIVSNMMMMQHKSVLENKDNPSESFMTALAF